MWGCGIGNSSIPQYQSFNIPSSVNDQYRPAELFIDTDMCLCAELSSINFSDLSLVYFLRSNSLNNQLIAKFYIQTREYLDKFSILSNEILPLTANGKASRILKSLSNPLTKFQDHITKVFDAVYSIIKSLDQNSSKKFLDSLNFQCVLDPMIQYISSYIQIESLVIDFSFETTPSFSPLHNCETVISYIQSPIHFFLDFLELIRSLDVSVFLPSDRSLISNFLSNAQLLTVSLENIPQLEKIAKQFIVEPFPIVIAGRHLIKQGEVMKQCRKSFQPRMLFLFSDYLIYSKFAGGKYYHTSVCELTHLRTNPCDTNSVIGLQVFGPQKSFYLRFPTKDEREQWANAMNNAIEIARENSPNPIEKYNEAPIWLPDDCTDTCMICGKSFGLVLNRKHHCRLCGKIICKACSSMTVILQDINDSNPQRICIECANKYKADDILSI